MTLSVVITTRNESANIANCIRAFDGFRGDVEVIVVDNASTDDTKAIAESLGAKVLDKGPERSAQRNLGWQTAAARWVVILDADMIMPREAIEEMLECASRGGGIAAYWIPEVRTGDGIRVKARNFERSFYDGTCIDALRFFSKEILEKTGGYDENLIAGPEDWELDIRVLETGAKCAVLKNHLIHNEKRLTLKKMLEKKAYYTKSFAAYQAKWKGHPAVKRQFSPWYRFVGVFVEKGKWKRLLRHPILAAVMYFERVAVGIVYLVNRSPSEERSPYG
jgi:glycosyltransferase involved in cell wall biosynthesis